MKTFHFFFLALLAAAQAAEPGSLSLRDERLQRSVDQSVAAALFEFAPRKLQSNQVAVTLVDLRDASKPRFGSFRGGEPIYPASVVKLFYLAAAQRWLEDGKLADTAELRRALRDMVVDSSNDATHHVLDLLTGTTSGPELPDSEMKLWGEKRNSVNRIFASLGYTNINCNQKTWCEGPYGRDAAWVGRSFTNRNTLTTDATARLLSDIARRQFVSARRCEEMLELLKRDPANPKDSQARFSFASLPAGAKLFSKAGWTSTTRHDAAYVELPDGKKLVLVAFTTGQATEKGIIPFIAKHIVSNFPDLVGRVPP
jgi:beta-lactamase class A